MGKFLNGLEITKKACLRYLKSEQKLSVVQEKSKQIFNSKFLENGILLNYNFERISQTYVEAIIEAKKNNLSPNAAALFFNLYLQEYEQRLWQDCSGGQEADFFIAGTPQLNSSFIFKNGIKIENKILYGNFGVCFDINKLSDLNSINDFVPFSYMITHNHLPKAILFLGVASNLEQISKNCDKCSSISSIRKASLKCTNPAGLVFARARKYVEDVQAAKHYADLDAYKHVVLNKDQKEEFFKIPIFKAIYVKEKNKFYIINNCKIGLELKVFLQSFKDFKEIVKSLEEFENNNFYPQILRYINFREIGCVDARIRNALTFSALIKEIGSVLNRQQIDILAKSSFDYIVSSSHTYCGYISTLYSIHKSNKELDEVFQDKKPILRKILEASYNKILNGEVSVLFGLKEVLAAIHELEKENKSLSKQTKELIINLIAGTSNDIRKTLRHALFREKAYISDKGYFILPAAEKLENILNSFSLSINKDKFDFLLNEESARENLLKLQQVFKNKNIFKKNEPLSSAYLFDLKTGYKITLEDSFPSSKEDFYYLSRKLFYSPSTSITFNFT